MQRCGWKSVFHESLVKWKSITSTLNHLNWFRHGLKACSTVSFALPGHLLPPLCLPLFYSAPSLILSLYLSLYLLFSLFLPILSCGDEQCLRVGVQRKLICDMQKSTREKDEEKKRMKEEKYRWGRHVGKKTKGEKKYWGAMYRAADEHR